MCVSERDVSRTDRNNTFFSGNDNPGLTLLHDVLMTYCMFNFDLGESRSLSDWPGCVCVSSQCVCVCRLRAGDERPAVSGPVCHPERGGVLLVSRRLHGAAGELLLEIRFSAQSAAAAATAPQVSADSVT